MSWPLTVFLSLLHLQEYFNCRRNLIFMDLEPHGIIQESLTIQEYPILGEKNNTFSTFYSIAAIIWAVPSKAKAVEMGHDA